MSYNTGLINSPTPGTALMAALKPLVDAHPAWVFVETVVGTTQTTDVYQCLGSLNSKGTDFFVGIVRLNTGLNQIGLVIGETYDGTAKTFGKPAPYNTYNGTTIASAADGSYGTPRHVANDATNQGTVGGLAMYILDLGINANINWVLSVTKDRILVSSNYNTGSTFPVYAGLYEPLFTAAVDPFPLTVQRVMASQLVNPQSQHWLASFTRELLFSASPAGAFQGGSDPIWTQMFRYPRWGGTDEKNTYGNKYLGSRIPVHGQSAGAYRGLLLDVFSFVMNNVTEQMLDEMVVGTDTLVSFGYAVCQWRGNYDTTTGIGVKSFSPWVSKAA